MITLNLKATKLNILIFLQVWSLSWIWPFPRKVDLDCQTFNWFCVWFRQHLVMVAFYHFWLDRMYAGNIPVPAYQALLVHFVNLSSWTSFFLLEKIKQRERKKTEQEENLSIYSSPLRYIHTIWNLAPIPLGTTTTLLWKKQRRKNAFAINTQVKKIRDFKNNNVCAIDIWINTT